MFNGKTQYIWAIFYNYVKLLPEGMMIYDVWGMTVYVAHLCYQLSFVGSWNAQKTSIDLRCENQRDVTDTVEENAQV